ncbi:DUF6933 domain-containing protein [Teredinibacter franksiae]|uniref:DUF6933 domain-containing protein n=1 Tax=Teredinibacter franksiae TaxID=2761453 RepID=UPI0016297CCA|nr:hypothetical protein [Teredinibacter franksiae]
MITIHCTKKLWAKLPLAENGLLPSSSESNAPVAGNDQASPLGDWHANLITLQRRNCVLLVHNATRFPVFIPCLTKPDFASLQWRFEDVFMNALLKLNANQTQLDTAAAAINTHLYCDTTTDRSVLGTLNQLKADIEHVLHSEELLVPNLYPPSVSASMAERPCKVKAQNTWIMPHEEMFTLLDKLATAPQIATTAKPLNPAPSKNATKVTGSNIVDFAAFKQANPRPSDD